MDNMRFPGLYPRKSYLSFIQLCHSDLMANNINANDFEIRSLETCESTNDFASGLLSGYKHTIILSMHQQNGRGRKGDFWESPIGGIWLSIGLNVSSKIIEISTPIIQILNSILSKYLDCEIKEPNDILINGKKICGLLVESTSQGDTFNQVVIGIGINVYNDIPENLLDIASRLKDHCDPPTIPDLASEITSTLLAQLIDKKILSL